MLERETLLAYLDGTLSGEECVRVEQALRDDSAALDEVLAQRRIERGLAAMLGVTRQARLRTSIHAVVQGSSMVRLRQEVFARTSRRGIGWLERFVRAVEAARQPAVGWAVAVVIVLLAGAFWMTPGKSVATLAEVAPEVMLEREGRVWKASPKERLRLGDVVRVGAGGRVSALFADGTRFTLAERSELGLRRGVGKQFDLLAGRMEARVSPQPAGQPLVVWTPQARVTVVGTEFALDVSPQRTRLDVTHGQVRIAATGEAAETAVSAGQSFTATTAPAGLFVCRGPGLPPEREVDFPFISGWLVRPGWSDLEPTEGGYDFEPVRREIALARRLGKKIALAVLGGPQAPDWLFESGVPAMRYHLPIGRLAGREQRLAVLWDEAYLAKWTPFIAALGREFAGDETIALIHVTGATGNGLEMQLPFAPPDQEQWRRLGYAPEKVVSAWERIIAAFARAFPHTPLDLDVHPVLGSTLVPEQVVARGQIVAGRRFGVFGGWLSGRSAAEDVTHADMHAIARREGPRSFAAFQMIASWTRSPGQFAPGGLRAAVEQGLGWNARYFELWETDAMNPQLHPQLTELAARLQAAAPISVPPTP
jgi:hypothetical protein